MKQDWVRTSLIVSIAALCFILIIRWNTFQETNRLMEEAKFEQAQSTQSALTGSPTNLQNGSDLPTLPNTNSDVPVEGLPTELSDSKPSSSGLTTLQADTPLAETITVKTDVLHVEIALLGGDIVGVSLPEHYAKIDTPDKPFKLMDQDRGHTYVAMSGFYGGDATKLARPLYRSSKTHYEMNGNELMIDLVHTTDNQIHLTKRFTFTPGSYLIDVTHRVNNQSDAAWRAGLFGTIKRSDYNPNKSNAMGMQPFLGAATSTDEKNYDKTKFDDIPTNKNELKHTKQGGWVAMVQHYFLTAWIPNPNYENTYSIYRSEKSNTYFLQFTSTVLNVSSGESAEETAQFYAGPKDIHRLEKISPYLDLTIDYSFLWWIAKPLFYALDFIHGFVGNWGVAIIFLTILIKLIFFYPSATSYRSMAKMRKVQPKMLALKERLGDNKQKLSSEMMKLYKDEKVNPLGGCLPILIQMPVFLALYWVLMESVELRHAPFMLWIQDLSVKDPFYVLPLIMGATMFIQQKLNPTPPDPMQAKIMQMMPVFFTLLFLFFPAGLVLYWVVNNTLSITQQYVITKQIEKAD